jgi:hypothetical protein
VSKQRRIIYINDIGITINDVDWNENPNESPNQFNINFDVLVNDKNFTINFGNPTLDGQNQQPLDSFKGYGISYIQFLKEVEKRIELRDSDQYSSDTEREANKVFGTIAQSIYNDMQSHSPDQDED